MTKVAIFKFSHCCLCPEREIEFKEDMYFYCKLLKRNLSEEESEGFPVDCPKPSVNTVYPDPDELVDIEKYMFERGIIDEK
ncbi:MAG: hypothetical protein ACFE9S_07600 [Candidatus Hermodarchaeota archaeon]